MANIDFDIWFKENFHRNLATGNRFETMYIALELFLEKGGNTIVETGTIRKENEWLDGMSTLVFGNFCKKYNRHLFTVDINPAVMQISQNVTRNCEKSISYHVNDSITFLKNMERKIDMLYLDSMDCLKLEAESSPLLVASQRHQLLELETAFNKLSDDPVILLDDNDFENGGKCRLSKIFLKEKGFTEIIGWKQSLWVKAGLNYHR